MARSTLEHLYSKHLGKLSDKWSIYISIYQRLFSELADRNLRLLEIGIQNGGSLEIWSEYFPHATTILGCDIDEACRQLTFDDARIAVVVGDANTDSVEAEIKAHSSTFDLIIDDGSHRSSDIIRSFARYFPLLEDGGMFVVEDLHCSYWADFEGGLFDPVSSIAFFKRLADVINHEHWGVHEPRTALFASFAKNYGTSLDEELLTHVHAVEFMNSVCVVRKKARALNQLGKRVVAGQRAIVDASPLTLHGSEMQRADQSSNAWSKLRPLPEDQLKGCIEELRVVRKSLLDAEVRLHAAYRRIDHSKAALSEREREVQQLGNSLRDLRAHTSALEDDVIRRKAQVDEIHSSTSWRITKPLRWAGSHKRLFVGGARTMLERRGRESMIERGKRFLAFWRDQGTIATLRLVRNKGRALIEGRQIFNELTPDKLGGNVQQLEIVAGTVEQPVGADVIIRARFRAAQPLETYSIPKPSLPRVSLVTDSIGRGSLFGGVGTALLLAAQLANRMHAGLRIVTRTEAPSAVNAAEILTAYGIQLEHEMQLVFAPLTAGGTQSGDDPGVPRLDIHSDEVFITTSWWTTAATLTSVPPASIVYLLQEDERMFYPFGDERVQCERVLSNKDISFVVNTRLLYEHLIANGLDHLRASGKWFEPAFPKSLFHVRPREAGGKKNFFFYARPHNQRNLFHLGVEIIERAINEGVLDLETWEIFLVGKDIPNITFGNGYVPTRCEGLDWRAYAELAGTIDLGFCLMYTPHPSYPPLDLAASGAVVVTNKFGNKQELSNYSRNIICADLSTAAMLDALRAGVALAENPMTRGDNFAANKLADDWSLSFEPILQSLAATH